MLPKPHLHDYKTWALSKAKALKSLGGDFCDIHRSVAHGDSQGTVGQAAGRGLGRPGTPMRPSCGHGASGRQAFELAKVLGGYIPAERLSKPMSQAALGRHLAMLGCMLVPADANPEGVDSEGGGMAYIHSHFDSVIIAIFSLSLFISHFSVLGVWMVATIWGQDTARRICTCIPTCRVYIYRSTWK